MGVLFALVAWILPVAVLVAAAVWAVNLSASVYAIQRTLERMDARQAAAQTSAPAPAPTPVPASAGAGSDAGPRPIDIEPFVE